MKSATQWDGDVGVNVIEDIDGWGRIGIKPGEGKNAMYITGLKVADITPELFGALSRCFDSCADQLREQEADDATG